MKRVILVYEGVYGNTQKIAEAISRGINKNSQLESTVKKTGEIHTVARIVYDAILFGCPNHN